MIKVGDRIETINNGKTVTGTVTSVEYMPLSRQISAVFYTQDKPKRTHQYAHAFDIKKI